MHRRLSLTLAPRASAVMPALLLALPLTLGACSPDYPMDKPGTWSLPPGALSANDANLRVMIVNPQDLTTGEAADGSDAPEAVPPVRRLNASQRPPLPDINGTPFGSTGQTSASPVQAGNNGVVQ